jgi:aryl-alcohol dehydrogenase-like predicted oxidoreductase
LTTSLDRLNTDYVDIYELHNPDADVPIGESLGALMDHVNAGRIRTIGCSNFSRDELREALDASAAGGYARFEVTQPPYSLADSGAQDDLFPMCREEQIAVTTYSPLAAGFLTGKYTPDRSQFPKGSRFDVIPGHADVYFSDRNFAVVDRLRERAKEVGLPMVRLAMAWAMSHPDVTSVLVGARTLDHVDNALAAFEMGLDSKLRNEMSAW